MQSDPDMKAPGLTVADTVGRTPPDEHLCRESDVGHESEPKSDQTGEDEDEHLFRDSDSEQLRTGINDGKLPHELQVQKDSEELDKFLELALEPTSPLTGEAVGPEAAADTAAASTRGNTRLRTKTKPILLEATPTQTISKKRLRPIPLPEDPPTRRTRIQGKKPGAVFLTIQEDGIGHEEPAVQEVRSVRLDLDDPEGFEDDPNKTGEVSEEELNYPEASSSSGRPPVQAESDGERKRAINQLRQSKSKKTKLAQAVAAIGWAWLIENNSADGVEAAELVEEGEQPENVHPTHDRWMVKNITFCRRCGYHQRYRTGKLREPCDGKPANPSSATALQNMISGYHPLQNRKRSREWDDGTSGAKAHRPVKLD